MRFILVVLTLVATVSASPRPDPPKPTPTGPSRPLVGPEGECGDLKDKCKNCVLTRVAPMAKPKGAPDMNQTFVCDYKDDSCKMVDGKAKCVSNFRPPPKIVKGSLTFSISISLKPLPTAAPSKV